MVLLLDQALGPAWGHLLVWVLGDAMATVLGLGSEPMWGAVKAEATETARARATGHLMERY